MDNKIVRLNPKVFIAIDKDSSGGGQRKKGVQQTKGRIITKLMEAFDINAGTARNWINNQDIRLTTPTAVMILEQELNMKGKVLDIPYRFN